jgi:hypothetical protein
MLNKYLLPLASLFLASHLHATNAATLMGWAEMPMHTYADGPTEGQFNAGEEVASNKQIIQGFSAVLPTNQENQYYFLTDNGFGEKNNSADALLRLYTVNVDFNIANKNNNSVLANQYVNINDPDKKLSFKIQADFSHYYNDASKPEVNKAIIENRLLTGADIDPESVRIDKNGNLWLGDEFGPFLINTDSLGKVLRAEVPLPNVATPDNPNLKTAPANLASTGGFEGMAINPAGDTLYPMLEGSVQGDSEKSLRIYQFDINTAHYDKAFYRYQLNEGTSIGDFVAINSHEFLVLERNDATLIKDKPFKKIYLIDINQIDKAGFVHKQTLVDLMQLDDPGDLNADGAKTYAFAYSHIENLLIIDKNTVLVANDNNNKGRTYFIKVKLDKDLSLSNFNQPIVNTSTWKNNRYKPSGFDFGDHTFFGWATVLLYFLVSIRTGYKAKVAKVNKENSYFWLGLTILLLVLGLNKQLDLQTNLTQWLRDISKAHGWYDQRRGVQFLFVALMGLAIPMMIISLRVFLYNSWCRYKLTWIGVVLLLVFVSVRAASFHHVDLFFYNTIGNLRYYQALEMLAIGLIIIGTFYENKLALLNTKNQYEIKSLVEIQQEGESIVCPKCHKRPAAEAKDGRTFKCKFCKHVYLVKLLQQSN